MSDPIDATVFQNPRLKKPSPARAGEGLLAGQGEAADLVVGGGSARLQRVA